VFAGIDGGFNRLITTDALHFRNIKLTTSQSKGKSGSIQWWDIFAETVTFTNNRDS
jgi:hypothetical protein